MRIFGVDSPLCEASVYRYLKMRLISCDSPSYKSLSP